jgi:hypothetical protein
LYNLLKACGSLRFPAMNKRGRRPVLLFNQLPSRASFARHRDDVLEASVEQFDGMTEWAMKILTKATLTAALVTGLTSVAYAQSANLGGLQAGGTNGVGAGQGMGTGAAGPSLSPGVGAVGRSTTSGGTGSIGSGPVLNNMRANGTSLNMNPDPRAPNVAGKAFGQQ